jgi:4-hydroxy-3-methylbut-2-enyl diphosphate reductase
MIIEIDNQSGFCFGVKRAVEKAEQLLSDDKNLLCLGEIAHNHEEVERLSSLGMTTITHDNISQLTNKTILLRTHGEPPSTYKQLKTNNNTLIDATCPVVLKLQDRIRKSHEQLSKENGQMVIFGKKGHPEVIGLVGQTNGTAMVITSIEEVEEIDFDRPIELYCQTTMPLDAFKLLGDEIRNRAKNSVQIHDTICRQVSNRVPRIKEFALKHDVILFVSGKNSSNGKALYDICIKNNPASYFISKAEEFSIEWAKNALSIGICGATSTPAWQMEEVKNHVSAILNI